MATRRIIKDKDFGQIVIGTRRTARNITMRVRPDGLHVTVPPYSKTEKVMATLETFRERLLEQYRKVEIRPIDFSYAIRTACFRLWLEPSPLKCFTLKQTGEGICICCPADVDFSCEQVQKLVRAAILRALKKSAGSYLPPLLEALAERYGFSYRKVKITGARSRWGSCSAAGTISLSCYLMLLPPHLMDYVLLHELSHTKEMNHGPCFWELLDSLTEGKALSLRAELRNYRPAF